LCLRAAAEATAEAEAAFVQATLRAGRHQACREEEEAAEESVQGAAMGVLKNTNLYIVQKLGLQHQLG
jgi:hypothetical protein